MVATSDIGRRAYVARVAQKVADPARSILGFQELIVEETRETGPAEALPDLEKVLSAARDLNALIDRLLTGGTAAEQGDSLKSVLRHDLRTPMNAIIGYSELVVEEFAGALSDALETDIALVLRETRELLGRIDAIVEFSPDGLTIGSGNDPDASIAIELARTLEDRPDPRAGEAGRILVIDDVASNRDLLARRLRRDKHEVTAVGSAAAALSILEDRDFDLALIDVLMPDMNGIELLGRLKANERWREMSVLMVSGLKEEDAVIRCIAAGAEDYLRKPFDPVLLRARISACLERRRWRKREKLYLARIEFEKERADALLHAMLPGQVVRRLAEGETIIADRFEVATILFADIVNFTEFAAHTTPAALIRRLGMLFSRFDDLADQHGIEKIKTIGDAYMAASGLPDPRPDHAIAAVAYARALLAEMARSAGPTALELRIGIHSGPVVAGLIGRKRFVYDIWGHTVNMASRLETYGVPGRIQISQHTLEALGDGVPVAPRGELNLRGVGKVTAYLLL